MAEQIPHHNRRWAILGVISLAYLMIVLDVTVMNVALPNAQKALGFSNDQRQWIVTAYSLAFGSMLLVGGKISDIFGRRRTFIAGLAGFAIVSAIGGVSQSFAMLAGARALQGLFGALLAPSALSLLTTTFADPSERGRAFGIWGAIAGSGASVGLLLGGALTQLIDWRAVLFVNLVLAAIAIAGGLALLHNEVPERKAKLDWPGTLTVTGGLFALVYGLSHAEITSWSNSVTQVSLVLAAVLLAAFVWVERHVKQPLLPLRLLASRYRSGSLLSIALAAISLFGAFLFLTYYMQQNLGFSPIVTGVAFLPLTVLVVITATLATTRLSHIAPRRLVSVGMVLGALAMLDLTGLGVDSSYFVHVLPALMAMGVALGLVFAPSMNYGTLGLDEDDAGVGSAAVNTSQQVGGAVGTALLSTLAASATTGFVASAGVDKATAVAQATVHGYTTAFAWSAGIFLLGAVVAALLFPRGVAKGAAREAAAEPVPVH
jgi:EmrB/QacA subfamily drug resistance transporter